MSLSCAQKPRYCARFLLLKFTKPGRCSRMLPNFLSDGETNVKPESQFWAYLYFLPSFNLQPLRSAKRQRRRVPALYSAFHIDILWMWYVHYTETTRRNPCCSQSWMKRLSGLEHGHILLNHIPVLWKTFDKSQIPQSIP
jgi:hypothetical protein